MSPGSLFQLILPESPTGRSMAGQAAAGARPASHKLLIRQAFQAELVSFIFINETVSRKIIISFQKNCSAT
jgi:hypothetical protein